MKIKLTNRRQYNIWRAKKVMIKPKPKAPVLNPTEIFEIVCGLLSIPMYLAESSTRKREVVQARQVAMYFSKSMTKSSLATIGSQIGDKDHATVLHACKTINNLLETDKRFRAQMAEIERRLKG